MHRRRTIPKWQFAYLLLLVCVVILNLKIAIDEFVGGQAIWGINSLMLAVLFSYFGILSFYEVENKRHPFVYLGYGLAFISLIGAATVWIIR